MNTTRKTKRKACHALRLHQQQMFNVALAEQEIPVTMIPIKRNANIKVRVNTVTYCLYSKLEGWKPVLKQCPPNLYVTGDRMSMGEIMDTTVLICELDRPDGTAYMSLLTGQCHVEYRFWKEEEFNSKVLRKEKIKMLLAL